MTITGSSLSFHINSKNKKDENKLRSRFHNIQSLFKKKLILYCVLMISGIISGQDTINNIQLEKKLQLVEGNSKKLQVLDKILKNNTVIKDSLSANLVAHYREIAIREQNWDSALLYTNKLADYFILTQLKSKKAFSVCKTFMPYISKCKSTKDIGEYYILYAQAATFLQEFDESLKIIDEGIAYLEKHNEMDSPVYARIHLIAGENSSKTNNLIKSVTYFEKASALFLQQQDTVSFLWSQNGLSRLLGNNGLYEEAEEARESIFLWQDKIETKDVVVMAHVTASIEGAMQGNRVKELYHAKQALLLKDEMSSNIKHVIEILTRACATYVFARYDYLEESDENLNHLKTLMQDLKGNAFLNTYYTLAVGQNAYAHGNYNTAKNILLKGLEAVKDSEEPENILDYERLLAQTYHKMGDAEQSLGHYINYSDLKDSIQRSTARKRFAYVQNQFEVEKKDLQISKQKNDIELLAAQNRVKKQGLIFGGIGLVSLFVLIYLYRSREFVRRKQKLQKVFSQKLLLKQENERTRLARELHDGVGQQLTLIKKKTQQNKQAQLTELTHQVLEEVRAISRGLYPPMLDKLGLTSAINQLIYDLDSDTNLFVTQEIANIDECLQREQNVNLYRFVQESLTNIIKHSEATSVFITVKLKESTIFIIIEDNGKGFNSADLKTSKSLGLKTLRERVKILRGNIQIESKENKGTLIKAIIPCAQ